MDVGGTLKIGDDPVDGAKEFLKTLRKKKKATYILSNTTTVSADTLTEQLNEFGFKLDVESLSVKKMRLLLKL